MPLENNPPGLLSLQKFSNQKSVRGTGRRWAGLWRRRSNWKDVRLKDLAQGRCYRGPSFASRGGAVSGPADASDRDSYLLVNMIYLWIFRFSRRIPNSNPICKGFDIRAIWKKWQKSGYWQTMFTLDKPIQLVKRMRRIFLERSTQKLRLRSSFAVRSPMRLIDALFDERGVQLVTHAVDGADHLFV